MARQSNWDGLFGGLLDHADAEVERLARAARAQPAAARAYDRNRRELLRGSHRGDERRELLRPAGFVARVKDLLRPSK